MWERYKEYLLVAQYVPREAYWRGYLSCKDEEFIEVVDKMIHGGITCETTTYSVLPESRNSTSPIKGDIKLIGFSTCEIDDMNIGPENTESFSTWSGIWNKGAVFQHLKSVIDTAEALIANV